jgi:hypothetical protein
MATGDEDTRLVAVNDLAGVAELAELGVTRQAISNYLAGRSRTGFPAPLIRLRATPVWSRTEVRDWYQAITTPIT